MSLWLLEIKTEKLRVQGLNPTRSRTLLGTLSQLVEPNDKTTGPSQPGADSPVLPRQKQLKKKYFFNVKTKPARKEEKAGMSPLKGWIVTLPKGVSTYFSVLPSKISGSSRPVPPIIPI